MDIDDIIYEATPTEGDAHMFRQIENYGTRAIDNVVWLSCIDPSSPEFTDVVKRSASFAKAIVHQNKLKKSTSSALGDAIVFAAVSGFILGKGSK